MCVTVCGGRVQACVCDCVWREGESACAYGELSNEMSGEESTM